MVGSIVTRAPSSMLAPAAFEELGLAVQLFENGSKLSPRIRTGMVCPLEFDAPQDGY